MAFIAVLELVLTLRISLQCKGAKRQPGGAMTDMGAGLMAAEVAGELCEAVVSRCLSV